MSRYRLVRSFLCLVLIQVATLDPATAAVSDPDTLDDIQRQIQQANAAYQMAFEIKEVGERVAAFRKAELAFASILDQPADAERAVEFDAELYVSWGNAAALSGQRGAAVLAFRRALQINPFHSRAQKNLEHVRAQLPAWTQSEAERKLGIHSLFFWKTWWEDSLIGSMAAITFAFAAVLLGISIRKRSMAWCYASLIPFLLWLILLVSTFIQPNDADANAVVFVAEESSAYTADSLNSEFALDSPIPAGTEAQVIQVNQQWSLVEFGDNKSGWVQNSSIRPVQP